MNEYTTPVENTVEEAKNASFFGVQIPKVELPKFELPKFDIPKFEFPKVELPKVDFSSLNNVAETVRTAASDTVLTATQTATKVRNSASHTVTLVREAVGV